MNPISRFIKKFTVGFQGRGGTGTPEQVFSFGQNFNLWNNLFRTGTSLDFASEVGDLRNSALVMAAYNWVSLNAASARPYVATLDADNKEDEVQDHPLIQLLNEPNPYYGFDELIGGLSYSWMTAATAYIIANRDGTGAFAELMYEPHWTIRPVWDNEGKQFISGYEVQRNGKWVRLPTEKEDSLAPEVLVFRKGIDPETRMGMSAMSSLMREFYTDQQAAQFAALLMRQGLVPPIVVSLGSKESPVGPDAVPIFKDKLARVMRGDSAGEPIVHNHPATVEKLGFDYSSIGLKEIREIPKQRFCAAMGISEHSLNLGTETATYNNVEQFLKRDYRGYIVPFHKYIAKVLTKKALPEYGDVTGLVVRWDYSEVPLMQPDLDAEHARNREDYKARIIDQAEAREAIGYDFEDKHVDVYYPVPSNNITLSPLDEPPKPVAPPQFGKPPVAPNADPNEPELNQPPAKAIIGDAGDAQDGADWWRANAPEAAKGLIDATIKPGKVN